MKLDVSKKLLGANNVCLIYPTIICFNFIESLEIQQCLWPSTAKS